MLRALFPVQRNNTLKGELVFIGVDFLRMEVGLIDGL